MNRDNNETVIALAGNPNVGKSTIFNSLTGLHQHTGNWPGKTVSNAFGFFDYNDKKYKIYDLPGTYSIHAHSEEEEVARDFICFDKKDLTIIVCDGSCLLRNLNLVLQICEIEDNVIVCINLLDEARKKGINIDLKKLSKLLGVSVIGTSARSNIGIDDLKNEIEKSKKITKKSIKVRYQEPIEESVEAICHELDKYNPSFNTRWIAVNLLKDSNFNMKINDMFLNDFNIESLNKIVNIEKKRLQTLGINYNNLDEYIVKSINDLSYNIFTKVVSYTKNQNASSKIDKILTNKKTGIPIMMLLLSVIFWITIVVSNYPSALLQKLFFGFEGKLNSFLIFLRLPGFIVNMIVYGVYRVLSWIISVMLPPMAIFFPLFTLLEDVGYLPRIAFNLDGVFRKCATCGKQALVMAMGFGCNAVGVSGCRIIDSKRERLIAILTNSFIPCNGRFPMLISIITMFFINNKVNVFSSVFSVLILLLVILFSIFISFIVSKILSLTVLKGRPSAFILELPPYRKPQVGKVIVRSIFDRTLSVLGKAIFIAIPAGLIIWLMSNINIDGKSLLIICSNFLDPFANIIGLDGVILLAFILGFPANEIVIPIVIMGYMSVSNLIDISDLNVLKDLLVQNGWNWTRAICFMLFSLMHFPCSTTCLTIKKETNSWKWTLISILVPLICGIIICFCFNAIVLLLT